MKSFLKQMVMLTERNGVDGFWAFYSVTTFPKWDASHFELKNTTPRYSDNRFFHFCLSLSVSLCLSLSVSLSHTHTNTLSHTHSSQIHARKFTHFISMTQTLSHAFLSTLPRDPEEKKNRLMLPNFEYHWQICPSNTLARFFKQKILLGLTLS